MDGLLLINKGFKIISMKNLKLLIKYGGMKIQRRHHNTFESLEEQEEIPLEDVPHEIVDAIYNDNNEDKK